MSYNDLSWDNDVLEGQLQKTLSKYSLFLQKLSTNSQVEKLSQLVKREKSEQLKALDAFIEESESKNNSVVRKLELKRADLTSSLSQYHSTLSIISDSNLVAKGINSEISAIDIEDKLIKKTYEFVRQVRALKDNIQTVHNALETRNYQLAAKSIQEIRELPKEVLESNFAKKTVPSSEIPEEPAILLDNWCNEFTDLIRTNFLNAAKSQNIQELTTMFKMFPMVGQYTLGLDLYSKYVCDIIANESRKIITGDTKKNGVFARALFHLFRIVSTIINDHSKIISTCYGKSHMIHVMDKVEKEADLQGGLVLDMFTETRKIERIVKEISDWSNGKESDEKSDVNVDPDYNTDEGGTKDADGDIVGNVDKNTDSLVISSTDLTNIINEYSEILKTWSMYARFFSVRWYEFSDIKDLSSLTPPSPILNGRFTLKLIDNNILKNFEILIRFSLTKAFAKSLSLEELPTINELISFKLIKHDDISSFPISSVLEDTGILVRENLMLTVNTGQDKVLSHFLDQLAKFYQNDFLVRFLQSKFKLLQPKLTLSLALRKYVPASATQSHQNSNSASNSSSRAMSPTIGESYASTKLSQLGFNFRGAAANALTNIQTNLQSVVSDEEAVLALHHFLIYINTLSMSKRFAHRLLIVEILEENPRLLHDNFAFGDDAQQLVKKVKACEDLIIKQTTKLQKWAIKFLFENIVVKKIRAISTNIFTNGNENTYVCGADDFEVLSSMNEFVNKWKMNMIPYQNVLCEDAYADLLSLIVEYLVNTVEQRIWTLKVNELGATKLDRELSLFIYTVCSLNYSLREKFTRLTQILLILGFDEDNFDTTGDIKEELVNSIKWVLSPQDRIGARDLKVDKRH